VPELRHLLTGLTEEFHKILASIMGRGVLADKREKTCR
jgi:hypothetical protein